MVGAVGVVVGGTALARTRSRADRDRSASEVGARALAAGWLAALALFLAAPPAAAHATLVSTDPVEGEVLAETPDVVTFTYDEPVSLTDDSIQVFDARGRAGRLARRPARTRSSPPTCPTSSRPARTSSPGGWCRRTATRSAGRSRSRSARPARTWCRPHVDSGGSTAGTKADLGIAQGLGYAGLLVAAGLVVFRAWMVGDVRPLPRPSPGCAGCSGGRPGWRSGRPRSAYRSRAPISRASAWRASPTPRRTTSSWWATTCWCSALQAVGLVAALLLRDRRVPATAAAALAVWSPALVGHTKALRAGAAARRHRRAAPQRRRHLAGRPGRAGADPARRSAVGARDAAAVVSRFSTVAAGVLALLVASGTLTGWRILGSWDALFGTTYGRLLMVKVGIALVVVAIAAWNRYRLLPRVSAAVGHDAGVAATGTGPAHRGRRGVPAAGGARRHRVPGQPAAAGAARGRRPRAGSRRERRGRRPPGAGDADPRRSVGANTVTVQIQDQAGDPVDTFAAPEVSLASDEVDLGVVPVTPVGAGTYAAEAVIPSAGTWRVQVSLKASEFDNPVVTLTFEVG